MLKSSYLIFAKYWRAAILFFLAGTLFLHASPPPDLRGSLGIHDPSAVIKCNGRYYVFGTGQGIASKSSADKIYWITGPNVFANAPSWTIGAVPGANGYFWAPDITFFNGLYHLYYAVSTFGSNVSAIGLATNPTLDPNDPNYLWTDQGPVIESDNSDNYNTIDPSVTFDSTSNLWMSFGSFWSGIKLVQLDPTTGLRSPTNSTIYSIANDNAASGDPIEASYLYPHGSYFYLFVNWGTCCDGLDSTYNIRVGRSVKITGPFVDRNGVNMNSSGGTLFLNTTGKFLGPGQMGILDENGTNYFGYHYLDANANGAPTFDLEPLSWTDDGWPSFTNDWSAAYHFRMDARDDNGQFYGLLENGASIFHDPLLGDALALNGTDQFVTLPGGAANAKTFTAVFKWNGGTDWQRIFDFGRGTNSYVFLTPSDADGKIRFTISASGTSGEKFLEASDPTPIGAWTHVAVTADGSRGILYVNGIAIATNASMTLTAPDIAPTNVWFGRDQFTNDPYFNGEISSIRIFGRALSADEIAALTNCVDTFSNPTNTNWTAFYSFDNGAADANGFFNGSLMDGATTPTDSIRGSVLNLSGANQYVGLPPGIGAMKTFSAWVKWNGGNSWQRIFDFGKNNSSYAMLTAQASNGKLRFEITPNGSSERRDLDSPNSLPINVWTHVAVTLDGRQAVLFINGQAVAVNSSVNLLPSDVMGEANYLGRSQFSADPYFNGQMDSVEISSETLPVEQITASPIGIFQSGSTLALNWPSWTNGLGLYSSTTLSADANWNSVTNSAILTNGVNFLTLMPTNRQMFFRLQLPSSQ